MRTIAPPASKAAKEITAGATPAVRLALLLLPLLVLPSFCLPDPLSPLDVASTEGATVAVFTVRVSTVVENVCVAGGVDSSSAEGVRNTSATAGAGTGMAHRFCV